MCAHGRKSGAVLLDDKVAIKPELNEHIDGLRSCTDRCPDPKTEKLHVDYQTENSDKPTKHKTGKR